MAGHRIYGIAFASLYPNYVAKAERKNRSRAEVDQIICWLTGHNEATLRQVLQSDTDVETFFAQAPAFNPNATRITGVICGHRVEDIDDPLMQKIRYLDKLVDELARGRSMATILRGSA